MYCTSEKIRRVKLLSAWGRIIAKLLQQYILIFFLFIKKKTTSVHTAPDTALAVKVFHVESPLSARTLLRMLDRCTFFSLTPAVRYSLSSRSRNRRSSHTSSSIPAGENTDDINSEMLLLSLQIPRMFWHICYPTQNNNGQIMACWKTAQRYIPPLQALIMIRQEVNRWGFVTFSEYVQCWE